MTIPGMARPIMNMACTIMRARGETPLRPSATALPRSEEITAVHSAMVRLFVSAFMARGLAKALTYHLSDRPVSTLTLAASLNENRTMTVTGM